MSRIGKKPVTFPAAVKVDVSGSTVKVEGPKGKLSLDIHPRVKVKKDGQSVVVERLGEGKEDKALHGLFRALINNMVIGAEKGFERKLEVHGVGFQAVIKGKQLSLTVGYAKPVVVDIPGTVAVKVEESKDKKPIITVSGADKQAVGQFAAVVRAVRKPEPYKGTGIRYEGEAIRRKAGKAAAGGKK